MENFFGLLIFILFMIVRTMGDRKKGMAKPPARKADNTRPRKVEATRQDRQGASSAGKPVEEKRAEPARTTGPRLEKKPLLPQANIGSGATEGGRWAEGESAYDNLSYMEGPGLHDGLETTQEKTNELALNNAGVAGMPDLRAAVIWSEIIMKPRFRTRSIR